MKALWSAWTARFDALQKRERGLIALTVVGAIALIGYTLLIDPALRRTRLAEGSSVESRAQLAVIGAQQVALQSPERDPDRAAQAELAALQRQLAEVNERLAGMDDTLVPPQRIAGLLENMVGSRRGLRLISLKTLPVVPVLERKDDAKPAVQPLTQQATSGTEGLAHAADGLFRHGVEIRLEGSYQELAAYVERLEQSRQKLLWSSVLLSAEAFPKLVLTLTVYTLSLDRAWLIV